MSFKYLMTITKSSLHWTACFYSRCTVLHNAKALCICKPCTSLLKLMDTGSRACLSLLATEIMLPQECVLMDFFALIRVNSCVLAIVLHKDIYIYRVHIDSVYTNIKTDSASFNALSHLVI